MTWWVFQTQNSVYEIVSDVNSRYVLLSGRSGQVLLISHYYCQTRYHWGEIDLPGGETEQYPAVSGAPARHAHQVIKSSDQAGLVGGGDSEKSSLKHFWGTLKPQPFNYLTRLYLPLVIRAFINKTLILALSHHIDRENVSSLSF